MKETIEKVVILILGIITGLVLHAIFDGINQPAPKVKQVVDHERYYCHDTGFLVHHWELQKGDGNWVDTLERNKWEEPIKCPDKED